MIISNVYIYDSYFEGGKIYMVNKLAEIVKLLKEDDDQTWANGMRK